MNQKALLRHELVVEHHEDHVQSYEQDSDDDDDHNEHKVGELLGVAVQVHDVSVLPGYVAHLLEQWGHDEHV